MLASAAAAVENLEKSNSGSFSRDSALKLVKYEENSILFVLLFRARCKIQYSCCKDKDMMHKTNKN